MELMMASKVGHMYSTSAVQHLDRTVTAISWCVVLRADPSRSRRTAAVHCPKSSGHVRIL
jgi:hypothetical protein